jgi:hypothetical protein
VKILIREKKNLKRKLLFADKPQKRRRRVGGGYDTDYGPLAVKADMDDQELKEKSDKFLQELKKDVENGNNKLQIETIGQNTNALWREKRLTRLTASKFGAVAKRLSHTLCRKPCEDNSHPATSLHRSYHFWAGQ